jgi:cytochrome c
MDFLDNIVLPQSAEHIQLLHYLLILTLFLFIPFIGILLGGTFLSLRYKKKALKFNDEKYFHYAKDIMEIVTISKGVGFILGILPLVSATLIYSQLLHGSQVTNLGFLGLSLLCIVASLFLIYSYRYSLSFNRIFGSIKNFDISDKSISGEIKKFSDESNQISNTSGRYGLLFLVLGLWFFITALTIPIYYDSWNLTGFFESVFNPSVILRLLFYVLFAFTLTGGLILFRFFNIENKNNSFDDEYSVFVKTHAQKAAFVPGVLLPLFMLLNLLEIPSNVMSGSVFTYLVISLILLFLGYHFLYMLNKNFSKVFASLLFLVLVFSLGSYIVSEQVVMKNSTKIQSAILSASFDKYLADLKGENKTAEVSGAEIYKVRCESCHRWDQKLIGPPHKDVIPKYVGKEAQLVAFIRNPVKINPNYPPMPNPGLKPNEAKAVAEYLLERLASEKK